MRKGVSLKLKYQVNLGRIPDEGKVIYNYGKLFLKCRETISLTLWGVQR